MMGTKVRDRDRNKRIGKRMLTRGEDGGRMMEGWRMCV